MKKGGKDVQMNAIKPGRIEQMETRLDRLEHQNRRLKRTLAALVPLTGLALVAAILGQGAVSCSGGGPAATAATDLVRAKRIEVLDESGATVLVAMADPAGRGKLVTYDKSGQQLVQIASTEDGGTVAVAGARSQLRAALAVAKGDDGSVFTIDGKNRRLISFAKSAIGDGAVFAYDRSGSIKNMWP